MVVMKEGVKESSENLRRQHDLPTPESPIRRSLICKDIVLDVFLQARYHPMEKETYQEIVITRPGHVEVARRRE
jgi:hypothetical protein